MFGPPRYFNLVFAESITRNVLRAASDEPAGRVSVFLCQNVVSAMEGTFERVAQPCLFKSTVKVAFRSWLPLSYRQFVSLTSEKSLLVG